MLGSQQVAQTESWLKHLATQGSDRTEGIALALALKLEDVREETRGVRQSLSVVALLLVALIGLLIWKL